MTQYICPSCGVAVRAGTNSRPQHCGRFMERTVLPGIVLTLSTNHQLTYHVVRENEPIVGIDAVHAMEVSPGTVYPVLRELEEAGVIESRPAIGRAPDANQWATVTDASDEYSIDGESLTP